MRLAQPSVLLLGLLVLAAVGWAISLELSRRSTLKYPDSSGSVKHPTPGLSALLARWLPTALTGSALLLLVLALARPQKVASRLAGMGQGIDILMVMDTSLSMNALDFDPGSRLDAAKDTVLRFIRGRVSDRIGMIVFGGSAALTCPLTLDYDSVLERVGELEGGMTKVDGTAIGDGIISGVNHMRGSSAKSKILILLTDGRSNAGLIDPVTAAKTAATFGIKIYAVGTATKGESLLPVDDPERGRVMVRLEDDLDEETLSEVARVGNGRYWRATSLKELRDIYAEIDRLEKSSVKLPDLFSWNDIHHYPIAAAIALLLLETVLAGTVFLRWP